MFYVVLESDIIVLVHWSMYGFVNGSIFSVLSVLLGTASLPVKLVFEPVLPSSEGNLVT